MFTAPATYAGRTYVFSERNWHDCDEHQRAVRTGRYKLIAPTPIRRSRYAPPPTSGRALRFSIYVRVREPGG